jgi:hypothetical protein
MGGFGHGISNVGSPMYIKFFAKKLDINTYKHRIINGLNVDKVHPDLLPETGTESRGSYPRNPYGIGPTLIGVNRDDQR